MLKTMKAINVPMRPEMVKILEALAKKHNVSRSKIGRAILTLALKDKEFMQKAMDIL